VTVAFFIAATVVTLLQYVRMRERRLLPLLVLFALTAAGHGAQDASWVKALHLAAGTAGLALVLMFSPRHPAGR